MIVSAKIVVFSTSGCPHSQRIIKLFQAQKIPFTEVNLATNPLGIDESADRCGSKSVPQVFCGTQHIGGLSKILSLHNEGKLSTLTQSLNSTDDNASLESLPAQLDTSTLRHMKINPVYNDIFQKMTTTEEKKSLKRSKKMAFKASDFVSWLMTNYGSNKEAALKIGTSMKDMGFFVRFKPKDSSEKPFADDDLLYQFNVDKEVDIINAKLDRPPHMTAKTGEQIQRHPPEIGCSLLTQIFQLLTTHTNEKGEVNFTAIKDDPAYLTFEDDTLELALVTVFDILQDKSKIVFLLQIYQILRLHLFIKLQGFPTTNLGRMQLIHGQGYKIQGFKFTLHVIAHLLMNGSYPATIPDLNVKKKKKTTVVNSATGFPTGKLFATDYRVLFAMIQTSTVSPPILLFTEKNVDFALHWATETFCLDIKVSKSKNLIICPFCLSFILTPAFPKVPFLNWLIQFVNGTNEKKMRTLVRAFEDTNIVFSRMPWENEANFLVYDIDPALTEVKGQEFSSNLFVISEHLDPPMTPKDIPIDITRSIQEVLIGKLPLLNLSNKSMAQFPLTQFEEVQPFVKRIVLSRNSLIALPPRFGRQLCGLSIVDLSYNELMEVPESLSDLKNLETLNLSHNLISIFPNKVCCLRNLKHLSLHYNNLQYLPLGFAQLRSLEELNLSNNILVELPFNFGEMGLLETLDLCQNKLNGLPDLNNLKLLQDLLAGTNNITTLEFGLLGLRHLITLDVSNNLIEKITPQVSHLVYLNEIDLSKNRIAELPIEICEFLCMKENGLDLSGNPITNVPEQVWKGGISAIRIHFMWEKALPSKPAARGRPMEMLSPPRSTASIEGAPPQLTKSLSVRDKRHLLMKNTKTVQSFNGDLLTQIRAKNSAQDSRDWLAKAEQEVQDISLLLPHTSQHSPTLGTQQSHPHSTMKPSKSKISIKIDKKDGRDSRGHSIFVRNPEGYNIELPGSIPLVFPVDLQDFDFKPEYSRVFYGQPHSNFLVNIKNFGNVIISIMDVEDEGLSKPKRQAERAKSMVLMKKIKGSSTFARSDSKNLSEFRTESKTDMRLSIPERPESGTSKDLYTKSDSIESPKGIPEDRVSTTTSKPEKSLSAPSAAALRSSSGSRPHSLSTPVPHKLMNITRKRVTGTTSELEEDVKKVKVLIRNQKCDRLIDVPIEKPTKTQPKDILKTLKSEHPFYAGPGHTWKHTRDPEVSQSILELEMKLEVKGYRFGLVYQTEGQKTENEFYTNRKVGKHFNEFLLWLGEVIQLKGWGKYDAGLDTVGDTTGKESLYTKFKHFDIMFHVSTMLPYTEGDTQQLSRKRHLGNDIVLIVFQEGKCPSFDPSCIRSFFNHVFFVISKDSKASKERGHTCYKIGVCSKDGVQEFQPPLPHDSILSQSPESREYLLTKFINAERAAYSAPGFAKAITRTREALISDLVGSVQTSNHSGWV